ncbi:MAG TPA: hypothetical protein DCP36_06000 [Sporomusaceae bacterium]|uniref:hypothetical protein n=1 Tax=Anaerospora sp. TaxID=1960278 RepID=UPI000EC41E9F|nr:hypothetical protein [Anaerospora sp.]MDF2929080.1 hypothetical protein [Anaerospora sp.]HAK73244.1 hypothetical protein [Sporomusaceae bacterium]
MKNGLELKSYTLLPEQIEALLLADFGDKLQPVDSGKLAKHRQQQANLAASKLRFHKPKRTEEAEVPEAPESIEASEGMESMEDVQEGPEVP